MRDRIIAISDPIIVKKDTSIQYTNANILKNETLNLKRKHPLRDRQKQWLTWIKGGKFQGANNKDFLDAKDLWEIKNAYMIMNKMRIKPESFRFVRYVFPDSSFGSLAEIEMYTDSVMKTPLKGKPISSPKILPEHLRLAFDGKLNNFSHTDNPNEYTGEWIGLDLGKQQTISGLGISPRNDTNSIMEGMNYELFYWGNGKWNSLGKGELNDQVQLLYKNAPANALFLLKNHTEGKEERPFTYENGNQVFW